MKLKGELLRVSSLAAQHVATMFTLMERYYDNVSFDKFQRDLREKDWVIQVIDPATGDLCGFSTQVLLDVEGERPLKVLFSGDTIMARDYWGDAALCHVWGRLALALIDEWPEHELYWWLISKGYKTYRFLPVFFDDFYPRYDRPTPAAVEELLTRLGRWRYPERFDAALGLVRADPTQDRLRAGVAEVTAARATDPHVRFFRERNPLHEQGDELCCLAPLTRANFTPAAWRVIGAAAPPLETVR